MSSSTDSTLLRRRRTIEAAQLAARTFGILGTGVFAAGGLGTPPGGLPPGLVGTCVAAIVVMTLTNALALINLRRPAARRYPVISAAQVGCDLIVMCGLQAGFQRYSGATLWPGLAVPIVAAALRHRRLGALIAWAVTSVCFAGGALLSADQGAILRDLPFAVGLHLIIALITGTQSAAFDRQVRELDEVRRELERQATRDPLTGLPNRSGLAAHAHQHADRPLAVLLLDLNGFKQINDVHGHAAGDELLRVVAVRMGTVLRADDLAGRLGGDEFLVLLPDAGPDRAAEVIDRLRTEVVRPVDIGTTEVSVGVSIGAAYRSAGTRTGLEALTAAADTAMYDDKAAHGRRTAA